MPDPHLATWVRYLVRPSHESQEAALWGVTRRRAQLLADQRVEPGTPVLLDLPGPQPGCSRTRLARVASAHPSGAGDYFLYCQFATRLSHRSLLLIRGELGSWGAPPPPSPGAETAPPRSAGNEQG